MTASAAVFHPAGKMLLIFFCVSERLMFWVHTARTYLSEKTALMSSKTSSLVQLPYINKKNNFYPPFFSDQTLVHSWEISAGRKDVVCKWLLHFCPKTSFLGNTHHHLEITNIVHLQKHTLWVSLYIQNKWRIVVIPEIGFSGMNSEN